MSIHVHIERLVLDGVPGGASSAELLQRAIEQRLGEQLGLGAQAARFASLALARLPPLVLRVPSLADASALGAGVGTALGAALGGLAASSDSGPAGRSP